MYVSGRMMIITGDLRPIIRVFPERTQMTPIDNLAFIGDPPLWRPQADEVHISTVFTWDRPRAARLAQAWGQYYRVVKLGGPAFDDPADSFVPGLYVRHGVTFTSRGCNFAECPWCLVPQREGRLREMEIKPGNIVQDNNLLMCSRQHIERVFAMLRGQRAIEFKGGLDSRLLTDWVAEEIRSLRIKQVFFSCDTKEAIKPLRQAVRKLALPQQKVRCYVLLKFNPAETISEATERMIEVWEAGAMPMAMLYQPGKRIDYPSEWRSFARLWSRPAIMKSRMQATGIAVCVG